MFIIIIVLLLFGFMYKIFESKTLDNKKKIVSPQTYFGVPGKKPPNLPVRFGYH
jgi:hypothetical protein|tara:strand:- start:519 stop:680 length:162 start_codon:yes stop_codon:yes gene_type:complete